VTGRVIVGRFGSGPEKEPDSGSEEALRDADRAARKEAQRRFDRPLILQAGAGTGKTTTLIGRLLAWTLGVGWQRVLAARAARPAARPVLKPEGESTLERTAADVLRGVVAITFTEAAAAEMAARASQELGALAAGGPLPDWLDAEVFPPLPEVARRARALLGALDHLAVRTIHAFCLGLLAEHPLEAGVHPRLQVDAEGRLLEETVGEVVENALRTGYGTPGDPDLLALAVRGTGPQEIIEALIALAQAGLPAAALEKDPLGPEPVRAFGARLATACEAVHGLLAPRLSGPAGRIRNAKAVESGVGDLIERLREARGTAPSPPAPLPAPPALSPGEGRQAEPLTVELLQAWIDELLPANLTEHLRKWGKGKPSQTEQSLLGDAMAELAVCAGDLGRLVEHLRCIDPALLGAARRALAPLLAGVQRELRSRGIATFDSLLTGAESLLARHAEVRARVRRSIDQLLVDEFQDTDSVQCEILRWIALDGPREELPGLFLVGDPKQSIYGWRSADLRAYDGFVERVKRHGGEVMSLVENFRSVPAILAEVARVIEPVMVFRSGLQPRFEPLLACERRRNAPEIRGGRAPVEHWVSWKKEEGDGNGGNGGRGRTAAVETAELEAAALAADVRSLHRGEAVPWKEIAVLLRSTGDLDTYLEALRRARVPFVVGRDKQYYRRREIIEAAALVRAVIDPGDHLALLTVLRSALVGVPDAALIPLWRREFPRRVTELIPGSAGAAKLEALRAVVEAAAQELPADIPGLAGLRGWEKGLLAALEHLALLRDSFESETAEVFVERLRRLFLPEAVEAARYLGPYRLANLDRFFRQLLTAVENGGGDLTAILRALRRSIAEAREAEEGRPQEGAEDAVQVMTIHGAKGLDFQHVYLVQLHKPPRGDAGPRTEVGRLDGGRLGDFEVRLFGAPTLGYDLVAAERARVEAAERVRTLYVAMTRAKDRLVLAAAWPEEPEAKPIEQARTHLDLLLARPDRPAEPLAVLWEKSLGDGDAAFTDPAGALWRFPALWPADGMADDVEAAGPDLPSPAEVARTSAVLRADRLAAEAHSARPFGGAASEEAHELLRQQLADRRLSDEPAPESPPLSRPAEPNDREAAMAAGGAVHRALEEWDLAADPRQELERQRALLPAYLTPLAGGDALERALPRAAELLEHFAASSLLNRLRELRTAILARELPVLIPPGTGPHAPVGVVTGAIDLLYRDPATGEVVIADYKTDEVATAADLDRRAAAYAPQGAAYVRAVQEALELKKAPRFELWFLRADRVVAVGRERT
jgi:ATP-dependent helicase/nuclease subunit A